MKTYIKIIILSLMSLLSLTARAASPTTYFDGLANEPAFDYTYISPYMLKAMGNSLIESGGFNLNASDLNSIEIIATESEGTNEELWKSIRKIKNNNKLELLSTKKHGDYRYDVLGKISGDKLTNVLVVVQNTGLAVNVVYIEGKIPAYQFGIGL